TGRVFDFITKLMQNPDSPGLQMKTPEGVDDNRIKVARVTDFFRAVLVALPEKSGYILASVQAHDDAYEYAARLRYGVNEVTGAFELANEADITTALDAADTAN